MGLNCLSKRWFGVFTAVVLLSVSVLFAGGGKVEAAPTISKTSDQYVTTTGLTDSSYTGYMNGESFQQDGIVSYNGWQYTAFWSSDRYVNIARRQLPSGTWQNIKLTDYANAANDAHNTISIGLAPVDGTLHLSFDHHGDTLHYRKSVSGVITNPSSVTWNASLFGTVQNQLTGMTISGVTYPRFVTTPTGALQLFFRTGASGDGDSQLYEYNGTSWSYIGMTVRSSDAAPDLCPYYFGFDYDKNGRLHVSWTWRETADASTNYNIMYAYSDDLGRTWKNNAGTTVATTGTNPITPTTPGLVVYTIGQNRGLINQESQTVDSLGQVHIIASHMQDSEASDSNFTNARNKAFVYHYWRNTSGTWSRSQLPYLPGVSRSDIGMDSSDSAYVVMPSSLSGVTSIATASASTGWTDWKIVHAEPRARFASEPLIDQSRMKRGENVLTFVQPEIGNGKIAVLDFQVAGPKAIEPAGNLATASGTTSSASSSYASYPAVNLNDGNNFTRWNAAAGGTQWIELNFGSNKTFTKVVLKEAIVRVNSYNIQYWNGSAWVNIAAGIEVGPDKTITFTAVTAQKVRLLINSTAASSATFYEFEVYP